MMTKKMNVTTTVLLSVLSIVLCQILGNTSEVRAAEGQDKQEGQTQRLRGDDATMPKGVIGVSLHVGAERIGDPASLYVAHVYPVGPAQQAGLKHGDEIVTVNGEAVTGKTYEQVIQMVRGEAGAAVKLGIKGEGGIRELSITRVEGETLYKDQKGKMGPHGNPAR
jgi:C-terminal processing protease CtpA/Prc